MRAPVAPRRPIGREPAKRRPQRLIINRQQRLARLRGTMLPDRTARPALADADAERRDRSVPTRWAHQFRPQPPRALGIAILDRRQRGLSRAFLRSSSLNRLRSAFIPPYCWLRQR